MMQGNGSISGFDPMRVHHHQLSSHHHRQGSMVPPTIPENFPLTIGSSGSQDQEQPILLMDYNNNKHDRGRSGSDDEDPSFVEDCGEGRESGKGKKASTWQRVKWSNTMVRLLITAVSYITEDTMAAEQGVGLRKKNSNLQKKGKWKSVSKVMAERGHFVSPQQCEDKFNDLNKRYKRLNEILGRGTSCEVVENPSLLDVMDHIPEKVKDEVRKILSSKHLHYEEMCSYHNANRLHLPPDPDLQRSLRLALGSRDKNDDHSCDVRRHLNEENDEVDQEGEVDENGEHEESEEGFGSSKRVKQQGWNEENLKRRLENVECESNWCNGTNAKTSLEEERIELDMQTVELEKERFKWQRFCRKKDRELETMKMEIEKMKLENERMGLELRRKELQLEMEMEMEMEIHSYKKP
ncbi:uncharacterized protein LOC127264531 [Andrographis paniculata]|uniref:uncharacterized protein LOC127264531 n=1 Tax=Andrographis paniculata TaxID=175694 RepID=UPI0021E82CE9|nr:uncharacterized protein LOC127264531 [Andrographis paniculata]XP_051150061.1 uncharacterized protein LOC127264531 [Andrographis paniculata]